MNQLEGRLYSAEELLEMEFFRQWVLNPSAESDLIWANYLRDWPNAIENINTAKSILHHIQHYFGNIENASIETNEVFIATLKQALKTEVKRKNVSARRVRILQLSAIAAGIFLLIAFGSIYWTQDLKQNQIIHQTTFGERKKIELPDGTFVELNANSTLKYASDWQTNAKREVWIDGEAFLEVKKLDNGSKFIAHTENLAVEVLGTSFNIHCRKNETKVYLVEGKVILKAPDKETVMSPGQSISYSSYKKQFIKESEPKHELHTSWKDGVLIMENETVSEILEKIKEIYGFEIRTDNKGILKEIRTIKVPMDKLEITLPILEKALGVTIVKEENQIIIH